jgi:hypothetical protein
MAISSPLQYHMNDLIYYLNMSFGGSIDKRISLLEGIAAMAKGMTTGTRSTDDKTVEMKANIQDLWDGTMLLRTRYFPAMDSNPYLVPQTRKMKIALTITEALAFFIIDEYKLITGSMIRSRLLALYGKDRYKGEIEDLHD